VVGSGRKLERLSPSPVFGISRSRQGFGQRESQRSQNREATGEENRKLMTLRGAEYCNAKEKKNTRGIKVPR